MMSMLLAKQRNVCWMLLKKLSAVDKLPHIADHHSNMDRIKRDVDDIIAVLVFLDEHGLHNSLPRYVCANPDNLPSVRLFDGDLHILLTRLEKLENKLARLDSTLADMTGEVRAIRCAAVGVSSTNQATVVSTEQHDLQHGYQPNDCISTEVPIIATTIKPVSTLGTSIPTMHAGHGLESKSTDTDRNLSHDVPKAGLLEQHQHRLINAIIVGLLLAKVKALTIWLSRKCV